MKRLVEDMDSIVARDVGETLPEGLETGRIELEISGIGIQEVDIISTPGRYGGFLRWFLCPGCFKRVGKLYLPVGKSAFLCRHCYDLGYQAQQIREFRKQKFKRPKTKRQSRAETLRILKEMLKNKDKKAINKLIKKMLSNFNCH